MPRRDSESDTVSRRRFLRASMLFGSGGLLAGTAAADEGEPRATRSHGGPMLDVRDFGARGDGRANDTRPIQRAVSAAHHLGGGVVVLPGGTWLAGTVHLRSRVTLHLTPGAVLLASDDDGDFAGRERPRFRTGSDAETIDFANALIAGSDLERVAVTGSGVIDMNRSARFGPKPIALKRCRFVSVRGVTIIRSPNYCVSLGGCEDVVIENVTIREGFSDGIDPDCCRRVRISGCDVEADDDALCLKASFLLGARAVTEDVVVTNCRLRSPSNCFKLGTESTGDFRQIALSNCVFSGLAPTNHDGTPAAEGGGVAILSVDGGTIDGVTVHNVTMRDVVAPLFVRLGNRGRDQPKREPGRLRNVSIAGVVATGASDSGAIVGLPGFPVERVTVENVRIELEGGMRRAGGLDVPEREDSYPTVTMFGRLPAYGLYVRHADDLVLRNLDLAAGRADARPALVADDVARLRVTGLAGGSGAPTGPLVWLNDVRGGMVQAGLLPGTTGGSLVRVTGEATAAMTVSANGEHEPG